MKYTILGILIYFLMMCFTFAWVHERECKNVGFIAFEKHYSETKPCSAIRAMSWPFWWTTKLFFEITKL